MLVETFRHLPPNSFIAMDDFENATAMATRLTHLMDNPDEYMAYFAWRNLDPSPFKTPTDFYSRILQPVRVNF